MVASAGASPLEASSPRRTGQSEIFNGLLPHGSSVSLIETVRRGEVVATEYSVSSGHELERPRYIGGRIHEGMDGDAAHRKEGCEQPA
jgi:hypothetical protein